MRSSNGTGADNEVPTIESGAMNENGGETPLLTNVSTPDDAEVTRGQGDKFKTSASARSQSHDNPDTADELRSLRDLTGNDGHRPGETTGPPPPPPRPVRGSEEA